MRKILFALFVLFLTNHAAYCATAENVQVRLTTSTPDIFTGQGIRATIEVVNIGKADLDLPRPDRTAFSKLITIDNPQLVFSGGIGITSVSGESPTVTVKPGQSVTSSFSLSGKVGSHDAFSFKAGLKLPSGIVWSNPVTIHIKQDGDLPVKIETALKSDTIDITDVKNPQPVVAHVRITNTSSSPQNIGVDNECGLHELQSLISNTPAITIVSGVTACMHNIAVMQDVILKPGEVYEQEAHIYYDDADPKPKPVTFRIGIKSVGHLPTWGNPVTVSVVGGSEAWSKHVAYMNHMFKETTVPPANGLDKKYYENGMLSYTCEYKDGKRNGDCKNYDETGKLSTVEVWHDGDMVSSITYNDDGSIHGDIKFMRLKNGVYVNQTSCVEDDSDADALQIMPHCKSLDANGNMIVNLPGGRFTVINNNLIPLKVVPPPVK